MSQCFACRACYGSGLPETISAYGTGRSEPILVTKEAKGHTRANVPGPRTSAEPQGACQELLGKERVLSSLLQRYLKISPPCRRSQRNEMQRRESCSSRTLLLVNKFVPHSEKWNLASRQKKDGGGKDAWLLAAQYA